MNQFDRHEWPPDRILTAFEGYYKTFGTLLTLSKRICPQHLIGEKED